MASFCPNLFSSAGFFFKCFFHLLVLRPLWRWFILICSPTCPKTETGALRNSKFPEIIVPSLVEQHPSTWSQHSGPHCPSSQGSPDWCHLLERMHWSLLFVYSLTVSKNRDLVRVSCPKPAIAQALKRLSYHHKYHLDWALSGRLWNLPEEELCWKKDATGHGAVASRVYNLAHWLFILCFLCVTEMRFLSSLLWLPAVIPSPLIADFPSGIVSQHKLSLPYVTFGYGVLHSNDK